MFALLISIAHPKALRMSFNYFGKDFAKQFKYESDLYSQTPEYHHGNLLVKQFTGNYDELNTLGDELAEIFFNSKLISLIVCTIRNEAIPTTSQLYKLITEIKGNFEYDLQLEPYTAHYYKDHIAMLDSFAQLINSFRKYLDENVNSQLFRFQLYIHTAENSYVAESSSLTEITEQMEFYLKNILSYYNYIIVACQYESSNGNGVDLTTYMADYLHDLIIKSEETIACIEDLRTLILTWVAEIGIRDDQEIYN
jgi:hypothetical protein